ncbi:MAG: mucin desulfatase, partial [Faecalibacterium sp.]
MKPVTVSLLQEAANAFDFGGPVVCDPNHYGEGHINDTFLAQRTDSAKRFILQRINTDTFTDPAGLMENVCGVTRHLRAKILAEGGDPARE